MDSVEIKHDTEVDKKEKSNIFLERIKAVNRHNSEWKEDGDLQQRQSEILARFAERFSTTDALVQYLVEVCLEDYREKQRFAKERHFVPKEYDPRGKTVGELFERLVAAENDKFDIYAEIKKEESKPKDAIQLIKEEKFIDVFTHPEKYGFPKMEYFNIPDIPFIVTREGEHLVLRAVAEVKASGHLDERAYRQLLPSGIRKSLEFTLQRLNSLTPEQAYQLGLSGFGKGKEMYMLRNFEQIVVMCRDVELDDKESLIARKDMEYSEFRDFQKILEGRHPDSPTTMVNSSFSRRELSAIFDMVYPEVNKKFMESITQNHQS